MRILRPHEVDKEQTNTNTHTQKHKKKMECALRVRSCEMEPITLRATGFHSSASTRRPWPASIAIGDPPTFSLA